MERTAAKKIIAIVRKYKIIHILFWTWNFLDLVHLQMQSGSKLEQALHNAVIAKFSQICCVYFVVYYLMPRFLSKGKYVKFLLLAMLCIPACGALNLGLQELDTLIRMHRFMHKQFLLVLYISHCVEALTITCFFFAVYVVSNWYNTEVRNRILEKERLENELNFLKAQINPHFLFNSINSVYVLIDEDKKLASQTLLKFSGMLRYQLYDCTHDHMPLGREIEFLRDYVDLEKLRNGENIEINFEASGCNESMYIAPFILIPFVENAFKHKSHRDSDNYVDMSATVKGNELIFTISNTYDEAPLNRSMYEGGIGLKNVQRRLELLYPKAYTLKTAKENGVYNVYLQLKLHEDAMHTGRR